jgi:hypothetical protein
METQELTLHQQKVTILSRLVKDNQLTLEEALLILKEEEKPAEITVAPYNPNGIGTIPFYTSTMPYTSTGTLLVNTNGNVGIGTTTSSFNTKLSINSPDADLNN